MWRYLKTMCAHLQYTGSLEAWALKALKQYFVNQLLTPRDETQHEHNAFCHLSHNVGISLLFLLV